MRILYDSKSPEHKVPFGTLEENQTCKISIHIPKHCKTTRVYLQFLREDGGDYAQFAMAKTEERDGYEVFCARFSLAEAGLYFYRFYIVTEEGSFELYKQDYDLTNMEKGELWQLSCIPSGLQVPEFYKGKVMYQIFPDRFCRGQGWSYGESRDLPGKLKPYRLHESTEEVPQYEPDEQGVVQNNDFFGGTLRGIEEKLPYLKTLGVSVIYVNPIFKAFSNHRYDTADYRQIDELLGTEEDFRSLCGRAHELSMRIILDGVFSHTGNNSVYFDQYKVFGNGALSCEASPYRRWYDFKSYPDDYTAWWGIRTLPCVKEDDPTYCDFIYGGEDSVVRHWLRAGADGFRLDVADELPDDFIYNLRQALKGTKPDALLIGEVWEDASNKSSYGKRRRYFTGGELDSVMNYPLRNAVIAFVTGRDAGSGLRSAVMTLAENYPKQVFQSLMNMLSTHDTARILNVLHEKTPETKAQRAAYKIPEEERRQAVERLLCAYFILYSLPGMPCIYYGDEVGMEGFEDPFCRGFFRWDLADSCETAGGADADSCDGANGCEDDRSSLLRDAGELTGLIKGLGSLRNSMEVLRLGDVTVSAGDGAAEILRTLGNESLCCVVNCGSDAYGFQGGTLLFGRGAEETGGDGYAVKPMGFGIFRR